MFALSIIGIKLSRLTPSPVGRLDDALRFGTGIQLLCIGIIGEYVARIYEETKQRPLFLVDEVKEIPAAQSLRQNGLVVFVNGIHF